MLKGCWRGTVLVALSGKISVIVDPYFWGFKGIIQRFELTATGMNVCGAWNIIKEHCSFIVWSVLAFRVAIHGAWIGRVHLFCLFVCWQAMYCWSVMATIFVSSYVTPIYVWLILYWADRLLCGTGKLKTSYIWSCCALFCMGTLMRSRNYLLLSIHVCWDTSRNEGCHLKK